MTVLVKPIPFDITAFLGMPEVNRDLRRRITEVVGAGAKSGEIICTSCIEVYAKGLPLGNHRHTEDEPFKGRGSGTLYLVHDGGDLSNPEIYDLPADGWEVTVPAGTAHTFVFDGEPDHEGVIAVLVSIKGWQFAKGVNTFDAVIIDPAKAAA